jgi:hypothetical protein
MNSIRNGLGMRKAADRGGSGQPANPHPNAVFTQVHNTLLRHPVMLRYPVEYYAPHYTAKEPIIQSPDGITLA